MTGDGSQRREFLRTGVAAAMVGVAGCADVPGTGETPGGDGTDGNEDGDADGGATGTDAGDGTGSDDTAPSTPSALDGWPMYQYDAGKSGHHPAGTGPRSFAEQWTFETGGTILSSPVVVDDTVYVGSDDRSLYALDAATGEQVWRFETGDGLRRTPAVVDGTVYVTNGERKLFAVDAADGSELWSREATHGSVTAVGDTLYVEGSAFDRATGQRKWEFDGRSFNAGPAVAEGLVFVIKPTGGLYALDAARGGIEWERPISYDVLTGDPTVTDGRVYHAELDESTRFFLYAHDLSGDLEWKKTIETRNPTSGGQSRLTSVAVSDDTVYVGTKKENREDFLYAFDAVSGVERWTYSTGGIWAGPVVVGDLVYFTGWKTLYALDATEGTFVASHELEIQNTKGSPAVLDGTVYVADRTGTVHALGEA